MKPKPKYKKGQRVVAYAIGIGNITGSHWYAKRKEWLYTIELKDEFTAGNVPESFISVLTPKKP